MSDLILVTGGAGFVGKRLVQRLRSAERPVRVLDIAEPAHDDDMKGSVTDPDAVAKAMEGVGTVFNLAGDAQLWRKDPKVFDEINHKGVKVVVDAALKADVGRFVHCSSLTTLVGKGTPLGSSSADENIRLAPKDMLGPYPLSKLLGERVVEDAVRSGLDAVIVLPTEPLGGGDENLTPPTQMIIDFVNGVHPAYYNCMLNFVPVESLVDGILAAHDRGKTGERYVLGGENIRLRNLLNMLESRTRQPMPKWRIPYIAALLVGIIDTKILSARSGNPPRAPLTGVRLAGRRVSVSSGKAQRELDWIASDVPDALSEAIAWLEERQLIETY
ncbi:MAG: NAD-dependent epimerase/dehydratase family protein [Pseudomonadota bacterium]